MHIYNITFNIDDSIQKEGLAWIKTAFIPKMLNTGKFNEALMSRVLVKEEMGGTTYAVQFKVGSLALIQQYYIENEPEIMLMLQQFKGKIVFFATEMEIVHHQ